MNVTDSLDTNLILKDVYQKVVNNIECSTGFNTDEILTSIKNTKVESLCDVDKIVDEFVNFKIVEHVDEYFTLDYESDDSDYNMSSDDILTPLLHDDFQQTDDETDVRMVYTDDDADDADDDADTISLSHTEYTTIGSKSSSEIVGMDVCYVNCKCFGECVCNKSTLEN